MPDRIASPAKRFACLLGVLNVETDREIAVAIEIEIRGLGGPAVKVGIRKDYELLSTFRLWRDEIRSFIDRVFADRDMLGSLRTNKAVELIGASSDYGSTVPASSGSSTIKGLPYPAVLRAFLQGEAILSYFETQVRVACKIRAHGAKRRGSPLRPENYWVEPYGVHITIPDQATPSEWKAVALKAVKTLSCLESVLYLSQCEIVPSPEPGLPVVIGKRIRRCIVCGRYFMQRHAPTWNREATAVCGRQRCRTAASRR